MKSEQTLDNEGADEPGEDGQGLYPMRLVARMTGLSAATIRAWERRHGAVEPQRTDGNTRMFSAADVRRLSLLHEATRHGHSIGMAAALDDDALSQLVGELRPSSAQEAGGGASEGAWRTPLEPLHGAYLEAISRYEVRRAHELLLRAAALLPGREFVLELVVPIIHDVGARWEAGRLSIAQEHIVSSQLSAVLATLLQVSPPDRGARRLVVATPPDHRHEFGVLIGSLLAVTRGVQPVYLGPDLPFADIEDAADLTKADVILLGVARDLEPAERSTLPQAIHDLAARRAVWLGCPPNHPLTTPTPGLRSFHDYESLDLALMQLGSGALSR